MAAVSRFILGCLRFLGGTMSHFMPHRSIYALMLVGAVVACSAPAQQAQPGPSSDVPIADSSAATEGTSLGSIESQGSSASSGAASTAAGTATATATAPGTSASAGGADTAGGANSTPASTPAEAAARARVQAARQEATQAQAQAAQAAAAQCQAIASQIRAEQAIERAAPSTSIDEDIVAATLAKADKQIDRLQQQYDSQNCPDSERPATHERVPQLPPAPGALPP
jgi:hypothetical protein